MRRVLDRRPTSKQGMTLWGANRPIGRDANAAATRQPARRTCGNALIGDVERERSCLTSVSRGCLMRIDGLPAERVTDRMIDPITLEVINQRLHAIADEMETVLCRSAFS